jgi:hypothetical protein
VTSDPTADNLLKTHYIALSWVDGSPLKWSDTHPATEHDRKCVIRAIANASLDLLRIRQPGTYIYISSLV